MTSAIFQPLVRLGSVSFAAPLDAPDINLVHVATVDPCGNGQVLAVERIELNFLQRRERIVLDDHAFAAQTWVNGGQPASGSFVQMVDPDVDGLLYQAELTCFGPGGTAVDTANIDDATIHVP